MSITKTISNNLKRIMAEHDLSSNELANRSGLPQKTLYTMINGTHKARIDNVEKIANALLGAHYRRLSPLICPPSVLMSQRLPRLTKKYAKLSLEQRDEIDAIMDKMLNS